MPDDKDKNKYISIRGMIKFTSDYSLFKTVRGNRKVYPLQVAKLLLRIKARGQKVPVIVNEKMEIIDGQHRVRVCTQLEIPVMYLIVHGAKLEDIKDINNCSKLWGYDDYQHCYSRPEHKNSRTYMTIQSFKEKYSLPSAITLFLLSGNTHDLGLADFRDGVFKIDDRDKAERFGNVLKKIRKFHKAGRSVRFAKALINDKRIHPNMNLERVIKQVGKYPNKIQGQTVLEFEDSILDCYNHQLPNKLKLSNRKTVTK